MSLASYSDLKTAVADWLNRSDLTAKIPDFISLCEAKLRRRVIHEEGLSTSVDFTVSGTGYVLPDDFNGQIAVLSDDISAPTVPFRPNTEFFRLSPSYSGTPDGFTISGGRLLMHPASSAANFTLIYKVKLDLLKYGPNWLMDNHPDAYLYGTLCEAEPYIVEDERVPMWTAKFETALSEILKDSLRQAYAGPLQLTSQQPVGGIL